MIIQFTLQDLMVFLVCAVAIAAGVILLPILWNIKKVVGIIRPLVEGNQEQIKKTIKTMPVILENAEHISINVKDTTDKLRISVPVLIQDVETATKTVQGSLELAGALVGNLGTGVNDIIASYKKDTADDATGLMAYFPIIKEVLQLILRAFSSDK
jgi:hypothetical protein